MSKGKNKAVWYIVHQAFFPGNQGGKCHREEVTKNQQAQNLADEVPSGRGSLIRTWISLVGALAAHEHTDVCRELKRCWVFTYAVSSLPLVFTAA